MYYTGEGTVKDYREALKYYVRAAEQNDATGKGYWGIMLYEGKGTAIDKTKGLELIKDAANSGEDHCKEYLKINHL